MRRPLMNHPNARLWLLRGRFLHLSSARHLSLVHCSGSRCLLRRWRSAHMSSRIARISPHRLGSAGPIGRHSRSSDQVDTGSHPLATPWRPFRSTSIPVRTPGLDPPVHAVAHGQKHSKNNHRDRVDRVPGHLGILSGRKPREGLWEQEISLVNAPHEGRAI